MHLTESITQAYLCALYCSWYFTVKSIIFNNILITKIMTILQQHSRFEKKKLLKCPDCDVKNYKIVLNWLNCNECRKNVLNAWHTPFITYLVYHWQNWFSGCISYNNFLFGVHPNGQCIFNFLGHYFSMNGFNPDINWYYEKYLFS